MNGGIMVKFDFSIQTHGGQKIESIVIMGKDQEDAERKLRQMYRYCQVLRCQARHIEDKRQAASLGDILPLSSK